MAPGAIICRVLVAPFIIINFGLYLSVAAISGWALNIAIDYGWQGIYRPLRPHRYKLVCSNITYI